MKKLVVVVDKEEIMFEGESLTVNTSSNANVPTALIIKDGQTTIAEFSKFDYWKEIKEVKTV